MVTEQSDSVRPHDSNPLHFKSCHLENTYPSFHFQRLLGIDLLKEPAQSLPTDYITTIFFLSSTQWILHRLLLLPPPAPPPSPATGASRPPASPPPPTKLRSSPSSPRRLPGSTAPHYSLPLHFRTSSSSLLPLTASPSVDPLLPPPSRMDRRRPEGPLAGDGRAEPPRRWF